MQDKPNALHTLGLELQGATLMGAKLCLKKGKPALEKVFEISIATIQHPEKTNEVIQSHVNPLYMSEEGQHLQQWMKSDLIATVLTAEDVLVRTLRLKLKKQNDIDAVLAFQAEPLLPYAVDEALLDRMILSHSLEGSVVTLMSTRKDYVKRHLEAWNALEIEPEVVSCVPAALAYFSALFSDVKTAHYVVHVGDSSSTCVLVQEGKTVASQAFLVGLNDLKHAFEQEKIADSFAAFDFSQLSVERFPTLFQAFFNLRMELTRALYALAKLNKNKELAEILFTGAGAPLINFSSELFQGMNKPCLEPISNPLFPLTAIQLQKYAVSIGAALSALPNSKEQINFLQQEFVYASPWKRLKKAMMVYGILCLCLAVSLFFFGEAYLKYEEDDLRKEYVNLLTSMNKTYAGFETEYAGKFPSGSEEGVKPLKLLSQEDIPRRLPLLEKELKDNPDTFPLMPNTPRVTDVLAWISNHPNMISKEGENQMVQIESFSYTMVKRPEPKKKLEKYQVKVELEFTTPTPKYAREFHDALIAPNEIVDPKGEVKWSSNRGKYRASFFLKDKTVYQAASKSGS